MSECFHHTRVLDCIHNRFAVNFYQLLAYMQFRRAAVTGWTERQELLYRLARGYSPQHTSRDL
jgi:hypothetical protein